MRQLLRDWQTSLGRSLANWVNEESTQRLAVRPGFSMNFYDRFFTINEIQIPTFFYGTAWKEENTEQLTYQALEMGFSGIDTANQRKHYYEEGVGRAIKKF